MRKLPLYTERRVTVEMTEVRSIDTDCKRCGLCEEARSVCIPPEGEIGVETLLVVGNFPTRDADGIGVAFSGDTGMAIRSEIAQRWKGPVVYTYAVRCAAGSSDVSDKMIEECRGYLAGVVETVKPVRIVAFGTQAYWGLTGRKVQPASIRRGYSHTSTGTPIYPLMPIGMVTQNRFLYEHMLEDLEFALTSSPPLAPWEEDYRLVENGDDAEQAVQRMREFDSVTFDVEYSGPTHTEFFQIDTLGMCPTGRTENWVWDEKALAKPECVAPLRGILEDPAIEKVGQGVKVDITAVEEDSRIRAKVAGPIGDTLIWRHLDDPGVLGRLSYQSEMVGMGGHKIEFEEALDAARKTVEKTREEYDSGHLDLPGMIARPLEAAVHYKGLDVDSFAYGLVASSLRSKYCALDVVSTSLLAARIRPRVTKVPHLARTWTKLLKPAPQTVSQIERWGFPADRGQIENVGRFVDGEIEKLTPKLASHGIDFKLSQDQVLAEFLYGKLGLPVLKRTKTGNPSVASGVLTKLAGRHPVIDLILQFKQYETIQQRYSWGLMDHVRADGRIHCRYNITGAGTGRFSSADPNMQNIPARHPVLSKMVKNIFTSSPGWRLVQIDYSQLEYRVAAILSGDAVMQKVFIDGLDLHRRTAEMISMDAWGIARHIMEAYDKDAIKPYRADAKQVNFGTLYGLGAQTLADDLGISKAKAKKLIYLIMGQFKDLDAWIQDTVRFCKKYGYVHTYFDGKKARWRPLWGIGDQDDARQSGARNAAINSPVQGSAADYMLRSLNEVVDWILGDNIPARVIGTVHDSMMLEIREDWIEEVVDMVVDIMESWWSGPVPLVADCETGTRWGSMVEVPRDEGGDLVWPIAS